MKKTANNVNKEQPKMSGHGAESGGGGPGDSQGHVTDEALSFRNDEPKAQETMGTASMALGRPRGAGPTDVTRAALAAGTATSLLFILGAAPDITWLDSSELAAAAFGLGVAHPPGHPLPSMLGHFLLTWLPLGSIAFRCTLASALAMGIAVCALVWVATWLFDSVAAAWAGPGLTAPSRGNRVRLALIAAGLFAVTPAVWTQAVRVEVYATQAGLALVALALLGRWLATNRPAPLAAAGLTAGLALSNHHMQALALLVPMAVVVAAKSLHQRRRIVLWAGFVALGLLVWLYLPLRAAKDPLVNWGHPDSLGRIWWVLSTKLYYKTASRSMAQGLGLRSVMILVFLATQLSMGGAFLALLGSYLGLRRRGSLVATLLLLGLAAASGLGAALSGFDSANPDSAAYVLLALAAVSVLALVPLLLILAALARLEPARKRAVSLGLVVLATAGVLALGWSHLPDDMRFRNAWSASDEAFGLADSPPPDTMLLTGYHETTFLLWYEMTAEGARPDVCLVFRHNLTLPGRFAQLERTCPDLKSIWTGSRLDPVALTALQRPLLVELDDHPADPFPQSLLERLRPMGIFARLSRQGLSKEQTTNQTLGATNLLPDRSSRGLRRFSLWHAYQEAVFWERTGHCDLARRPWMKAWSLAPKDPLLLDLAKRCRLVPPDERQKK